MESIYDDVFLFGVPVPNFIVDMYPEFMEDICRQVHRKATQNWNGNTAAACMDADWICPEGWDKLYLQMGLDK